MTQVETRTTVFADRLGEAVERRRSQLVLGLDPVLDLLPVELQGDAVATDRRREATPSRASAAASSTRPRRSASRSSRSSPSSRRSARTGMRAFEETCALRARSGAARHRRREARRHRLDGARLRRRVPRAPRRRPAGRRRDHAQRVPRARVGGAVPRRVQARGRGHLRRHEDVERGLGRRAGSSASATARSCGITSRSSRASGARTSSASAACRASASSSARRIRVRSARRGGMCPQQVLLLPGIGAQGAGPGRGRARVHERAGERARGRVARDRLRLPRARRRLADGRRRRGRSPARRDPGRLGLVNETAARRGARGAPACRARARCAVRPPVDARAYLVVDGRTGEVLAARNAHARMPIASVTKLMTVLVALEHLKLDDTVSVQPTAAGVGESSIGLRAGERLTVHDLLEGALIQSANDAAYALAASAGGGNVSSFVREMNAKARALHLARHALRPPGRARRAGRVLERRGRDAARAHRSCASPPSAQTVKLRTANIAGGRVLHTWNDLLGTFPGLIGVKTGHTGAAGWCEVAAVRRPGVSVYATILGSPSRDQRNADLAALLRWGLSRYRVESVIAGGTARTRSPRPATAASLLDSSPRRVRGARSASTGRSRRASSPPSAVEPARARGPAARHDPRLRRQAPASPRARSSPRAQSRVRRSPARVGFYARRTAKHIWSWIT